MVKLIQVNPNGPDQVALQSRAFTYQYLFYTPDVDATYYIHVTGGASSLLYMVLCVSVCIFPVTLFSCALTNQARQRITDALIPRREPRNHRVGWIGG